MVQITTGPSEDARLGSRRGDAFYDFPILDTRSALWNCACWRLASMVQEKHVLAIASGGGHWQQLMRLRPAFEGQRTSFVTTNAAYAVDVPGHDLSVVMDANRDQPVRMIGLAFQMLVRVLTTRPDVIISTGAAPGILGIFFGRLVGARTIWIDSIANAERLSLSGRIALRVAHTSLTQWPHLAKAERPEYHGSIL